MGMGMGKGHGHECMCMGMLRMAWRTSATAARLNRGEHWEQQSCRVFLEVNDSVRRHMTGAAGAQVMSMSSWVRRVGSVELGCCVGNECVSGELSWEVDV